MCFRPSGISLPKKCPACGAMNDSERTTCEECGADLPESSLPGGAPGALVLLARLCPQGARRPCGSRCSQSPRRAHGPGQASGLARQSPSRRTSLESSDETEGGVQRGDAEPERGTQTAPCRQEPGSGTHPEPVLLLCGRRNRAGSPRKASWQPRPNGDPWPLLPDRRSRRVNSPPCCAMADAPVITGEVLEPASTRRFYRPLRLPRPNRGSAIAPSGSGGSHAYTACERQKRGRLHRKRSSLPLFSSCGAFDVLQQRLGA